MLYLYLITIGICLYSTLYKKSGKILEWYCFFSLLILACAPRTGFDTDGCVQIFKSLSEDANYANTNSNYLTMAVYLALMRMMQSVGVQTFFVFKFLTLFFVGLFAKKTIGKDIDNVGTFSLLYLLSTFSIDAIQHRNTIALLLFLIGIHYYLNDKEYGKAKYALFVFLATLFHFTFIIFFVFLIVNGRNKKSFNLYRILFLSVLIICSLLSVQRKILNYFATVMIYILKNPKLTQYFYNRVNWGFIVPLFMGTVQVIITYALYRKCNKKEQNKTCANKLSFNIADKYRFLFYSSVIMYFTCILLFFSLSTYRVMRDVFVVVLIFVSNYINSLNIRNMNRAIWIAVMLIICIFNMAYFNSGAASDIIFAIFNGELFWI